MTIPDPAADSSGVPAGAARGPLRVAIAGLGRDGLSHATVLAAMTDVEIVGAYDPRTAARRNLRGLGHGAPGFSSFEKLLAKTRPGAVLVCGPQGARATIVRASLESGAAVMAESPMALTAAEVETLAALARTRNLPLAATSPLAFQPVFAAACRAVEGGALGTIGQARASMYLSRVFSPRDSRRLGRPLAGGVVAHHALDLLGMLADTFGPPTEVRARWNCLYGQNEDEFHGMMKLAGGAEIGIDASWSVPGHARPATVIEIHGESGHLLVSDDALELELRVPHAGYSAGHTRLSDAELPQSARFDLDGEARWLEDAAFVRWILGGPAIRGAGDAALRTQRLMEALYASARADGTAVQVGG